MGCLSVFVFHAFAEGHRILFCATKSI